MITTTFAQIPPIETGVSQNLAKWRAANYSDVRYKLNLTLEKMSPTLKGKIEVRVKLSDPSASADGINSSVIILDWRKIGGKEDLSTVSNVSINGAKLNLQPRITQEVKTLYYDENNEHLIFKDGVTKGENVIKLDFTSPIATSGAAVRRYVDKVDGMEYVYSLFVPSDASTAFPVFDQPDLKARFQLSIRPPQNWKVVSNTVVSSRPRFDPMDTGVYVFEETKPISTYVFAFAAGDFVKLSEKSYEEAFKELEKEGKTFDTGHGIFAFDDDIRAKMGTSVFVRKSQAEKFKQYSAEVFRLNRKNDYSKSQKLDIVLLPDFSTVQTDFEGLRFMRESSVFR